MLHQSLWSPHFLWNVSPLLQQTLTMSYSWDSLSLSSCALPGTYVSSPPAPSVPLVLGQHVLLVSPASHTYFGHLKSIVRLEDSYLVVSVSPQSSAYGPFIPESCHIHLPPSFILLPWTC